MSGSFDRGHLSGDSHRVRTAGNSRVVSVGGRAALWIGLMVLAGSPATGLPEEAAPDRAVTPRAALAAELFDSIPAAELDRWLAGADASEIVLFDGRSLAEVLAKAGGMRSISWFTVDSGGGEGSSDLFRLRGTSGQPDAGLVVSGPGFSVIGGFWAKPEIRLLFADGFESGDTSAWSSSTP